jgi:4-amino-4-deoxy-L-arabinose transferase-like glycosyltransferase
MANSLQAVVDSDYARQIEATVDQVAGSRAASLAVLIVIALACFLPGFAAMPPIDGDGPSYAVAARDIVMTGDFPAVRVQTDMQPWRPRGMQWLEAIAVMLAGRGPNPPLWVFRVPSLIGAVATVILTWWTMLAFGRPRAALLAGILVAGSGILGLQARLSAPDAMLVAATTLAAGALARIWLATDERPAPEAAPLLFWLAIAVGLLLDGVVAPAMAAAAVLVLSLERGDLAWLARLRPGVGVAVIAVAVLPWLASIAGLAISDSSGPDIPFLTRIGVPFELEAPPTTYALFAPLLAGPAMTFLFAGTPWLVSNVRRPAIFFALAWGAPLWVVAELITYKLAQYVLPAVPAIAMLAATAVDADAARIRGRISQFYSSSPLIWPPVIAVAIPALFFSLEGRFPLTAFVALALAGVIGPVAWFWLRRGQAVAATVLSVVSAALIYLGFFGWIVPGLSTLRVAERVVATGTAHVSCADPTFAAAGFPEESLVLIAGRGTLLTDGWGAADFLNARGCRIAAIDTSQISSFRQRADDLGLDLIERGRVVGVDTRKMRRVDMHLFSVRGTGI